PTNQLTNQLTNQPTNITVETVLWALIALIALAFRLSHLDAAPLNAGEAREAMFAWRAATGVGLPFHANYSPLLFVANSLLFTLCGTSDALARLWPALFGSALALTPFLLRQRIGRVGALAAGLYLALSPTALFASRQLDGAVVAAVGGMIFLGSLVRFLDTDRRPWLTLSAGGLALAVSSSSSAYGLLLTLGLAWLILSRFTFHTSRFMSHVSRSSLVFLLATLALSTGLGWNPGGLGAAGDLLPAWIARFGSVSAPVASPLTLVAIYEPLVLLFGLGGLVWAMRRGWRFGALLGLWAGLGALLLALMPGRAPLDMLWVVLPLVVLTGIAVERLVRGLQAGGAWLSEGLYVPVVLSLWAHFYLVLARYAEFGNPVDLTLALLVVALQVLLAIVFALAMHLHAALRGVVVGTGIVLLAVTLSVGWGLAHVRPADPRELLVRQPTAIEVRDLVRTLRDLSWRETGMPTTLPFTLEAIPDPVLAWYLRDFSAARRVESLGTEEIGPVLVTSRRELTLPDVPDDAGFVGQDFALRRSWNPVEVGCVWQWPPRCEATVGWLLLRRTPSLPVADGWAVLWLRRDMTNSHTSSHSH
nr:hypothetical protein [Anaerolineae bacterium]